MEITDPNELIPFIELIERYNNAFYKKDIEAFRLLHIDDDAFVFFDNHAACDSINYTEHESKVYNFFQTGSTVELSNENIRVFRTKDMACITLTMRYSTQPHPGVRSTFVVQSVSGDWKIRHMHHSFDPNEND